MFSLRVTIVLEIPVVLLIQRGVAEPQLVRKNAPGAEDGF